MNENDERELEMPITIKFLIFIQKLLFLTLMLLRDFSYSVTFILSNDKTLDCVSYTQ
jgi:hypothetical protein